MTPLELARLGYRMVPWKGLRHGERKPCITGFTHHSMSPESVAEWASRDYDWAIIPTHTIVLDLENKNGLDGQADLRALCEAHGEDYDALVAACAVTRTKSDGRHLWFRAGESSPNAVNFHLRPGLEVKRGVGSAHVPPSEGYEWIRPLGDPADLPEFPQWLADECFARFKERSQAKDYKVPKFANGQRRELMLSIAGKARDTLGLSPAELVPLLRAIRETRCEDLDTFPQEEVDAIAIDIAKLEASDPFGLALAGDECARSVLGFVAERNGPVGVPAEPAEEVEPQRAPSLSEADLRPTPMMREWLSWIDDINFKPQPELALLGVCTAIGAIIGRRLHWRGSSANMYALGLVGSGSGKDACVSGISTMLRESGHELLLGSGTFGSDVGLYEEIASNPEILWVQDEFHEFVSRLAMPAAPTYVKGIERVLLETFSGRTMSGRSLKGTKTPAIQNPYPCLYALSQPKTFWKAYNTRLTDSGFLGRFIIFNGRDLPPVKDGTDTHKPPPADVVAMLTNAKTEWQSLLARRSGSTPDRVMIDHDADCLAEDTASLHRIDAVVQSCKGGDSAKATLYARTSEKIKKLALVHAWSLNPGAPRMTVESIQWAERVMCYANDCLLTGMRQNVSENATEDSAKRVLNVIEEAGVLGISMEDLYQKTRFLRRRDRDDILDDLAAINKVKKITTKGNVGRPKTVVVATKY